MLKCLSFADVVARVTGKVGKAVGGDGAACLAGGATGRVGNQNRSWRRSAESAMTVRRTHIVRCICLVLLYTLTMDLDEVDARHGRSAVAETQVRTEAP